MKSTSVILSAASLLCLSSAHAAISFTGIHSESFDSLPSAGEAAIEGTSAVGNQVAVPGLANWQLAKVGGSATGNSSIHTSQLTGGRFYSYGATNDSDRALGSLGSGSFWGVYGTTLINDSSVTYHSISFSFTRELWVVQGTGTTNPAEDRVTFSYGFSGDEINAANFLTSTAMTAVSELDLVSPAGNAITGTVSGTNPDRSRDGNSDAWSELVTATISGLEWQPGQEFHIRWRDTDSSGFDAGLAIDNLTVSAVPEPSALGLMVMGALGLGGLRRRG